MTCPSCRISLIKTKDYNVFFSCGHGYHLNCINDKKHCYKCLNDKGWTPSVKNFNIPDEKLQIRPNIIPPEFMRKRDLTLKLGAPTVIPDLDDII